MDICHLKLSTPWEALCVNLVGPYTLKGKDGSSIDFTMILAGNDSNMSATCHPDSQMSALLANISLSWRHKTDPDTVFWCQGLPTYAPFFLLPLPSTMPHPCSHPRPLAGIVLILAPLSALACVALAPRHCH